MNFLNGKNKTIDTALVAVIVALSLFMFAESMTKELGHDEHMYCTAGYLTAKGGLIYRDFTYVAQLPYHPLVLAVLYKLTGTTHYLLVGRLFSVICEVGVFICIAGICKHILRRFPLQASLFAIASVVIYAMNPFTVYASGYAWNHSMVILCVLISLWLFITMDFNRLNFRRFCIIAALLTIATFTRPTAALVYVVFALTVVFISPARLKRSQSTALPFVIGTLIFAVWPIIIMTKAPEALFLNIIRIPALNAAFLNKNEWVHSKAELTKLALLTPAYIGMIIFACYFMIMRFITGRPTAQTEKSKERLCIAVAAAFMISVFVPPTMWRQYWAVPIPFILICLAYPFSRLCDTISSNKLKNSYLTTAGTILVLTVVASLYISLPFSLKSVPGLFDRKAWIPLQLHNISSDIHDNIITDGPVLTLSPLYAIEGGSTIYPQFSAGPFVYRIADDLSEKAKQYIRTAGMSDLKQLIESSKPSAVILGTEPQPLENPIYEQLADIFWIKKTYEENGLTVLFRKPGSDMN